jgi:hypothetical protein
MKMAPRNNGVDQIVSTLPRITGVGTLTGALNTPDPNAFPRIGVDRTSPRNNGVAP